MELKVLRYLAERPDQIVAHSELLQAVWGYTTHTKTRTVYSTLHRLRQALEPEPSDPQHLQTVPGRGVQLVGLRSGAPSRTNLRPGLDAFVGRGALLQQLASSEARLVTLLGPSGAGKTRLAIEHGLAALGRRRGGCWLCDLSRAVSPDDVEQALACVLGLAPGAELGPALERRGALLLILDDLEPTPAIVGALIDWLQQAPLTRLLITTNTPLGAAGEQRLLVGPLQPPRPGALDGGAVELFVARARAVVPGFDPQPVAEALTELLEALDHLPLAIELAAPQAALLSPRAVLGALLRHGSLRLQCSDRPARHRSLDQLVASSCDRLPDDLRHGLSCLGVFADSFELEPAQIVLSAADHPLAAHELVFALLERGLLQRDTARGEPRFRLLSVVRRFLERHPAPQAALQGYVEHYARLAEALFAEHHRHPPTTDPHEGRDVDEILSVAGLRLRAGAGDAVPLVLWAQVAAAGSSRATAALELSQQAMRSELSPEGRVLIQLRWEVDLRRRGHTRRANVLRHQLPTEAITAGRPDLAASLTVRIALDLLNQGHAGAAQRALEQALIWWAEVPDPPDALNTSFLAAVANLRGSLALRTEDPAAAMWFSEAIERYRSIDQARDAASVQMNLGTALAQLERFSEAEIHVRAALEALPRRWRGQRAIALIKLASVLGDQRDHHGATEAAAAAVELCEASDHVQLTPYALSHWGRHLLQLDRIGEAQRCAERALRLVHGRDQRLFEAHALCLLGRLHHLRGEPEAGPVLLQALEHAEALSHPYRRTITEHLVQLLTGQGRHAEAIGWLDRSLEPEAGLLSAARMVLIRAELHRTLGDRAVASADLRRIEQHAPPRLAERAALARAALVAELGGSPEPRHPTGPIRSDPWSRVFAARIQLATGDPLGAGRLVEGLRVPPGDVLLSQALDQLRPDSGS